MKSKMGLWSNSYETSFLPMKNINSDFWFLIQCLVTAQFLTRKEATAVLSSYLPKRVLRWRPQSIDVIWGRQVRGEGRRPWDLNHGTSFAGLRGRISCGQRWDAFTLCFATSPNKVLASLRKSVGTEPLGCRYTALAPPLSLSLSLSLSLAFTTAAARSGPRDPSLSQGEYLENIWKRQWISKQCTCSRASQAVVTPWPLGSLRYKQTSRPLLSICLGADILSERNPVTGK
jgi:hypothetical protein